MSETSRDRATDTSHRPESGDIDAQIRLAELEIKKAEAARIRAETGRRPVNWTVLGPLLGAVAVALSTVYVALVSGQKQGEIESLKATTTLIIEAVKTGSQDPALAQRNLQFFLDAGLLADATGRISKSVKAGIHPVLAVTATPPAVEFTIFASGNIAGVTERPEGPPQPTTFTIFNDHFVTFISTYHWNGGRGKAGGQIILKREDGTEVSRCDAVTSSGQNDAANVNWFCQPNIKIPAGAYAIVDSDKATWSYNRESRGMGFSTVRGYPTLMQPR